MNLPFDGAHLDDLMERAGIDLIFATTKHNVQYLLGGYRFFFFSEMDAIGLSRYLPVVAYPRGKPENAFYIGHPMEVWEQAVAPPWMPTVCNTVRSSETAVEAAAPLIAKLGHQVRTIGVEMPFLPADAHIRLGQMLPGIRLVDAVGILEELRAVKQPSELVLMKEASEAIVDSMLATIQQARAGTTTQQLADQLRREETARGLIFNYCLVATNRELSRAPSQTPWEAGTTLSLDSGGTKHGYIGDLARMAIIGRPTSLMQELLEEVDCVQMSARLAANAGALGSHIYESARTTLARLPHRSQTEFVAHGVGLVSHEAPHLTGVGASPYPGIHEDNPLRAGMVLSIETTIRNADVGFVKLEDTVVVTDHGPEAFGDHGRAWNIADGS